MTRPVASQRFRQRKLNTRSALEVLREKDLDTLDSSDQQNTPRVETGVEKHEETEHHLQAAISASKAAAVGGNVAQIYIPTPETAQSTIPYEQLYQLRFSQPATYIRFSSTVEDCCGCAYNMTEEDDEFLKQLNEKSLQRKLASTQCSEDQFEEAMNFFEETAKVHQPFSSVGEAPPIVSWEDMQNAFDENIDELARTFATDIYPHWKARREANGNAPLQAGLKLKVIESATDADDNDPYVCFRRREVRQVRKTRGRDAQSVEKLKKLRKELEEARQLVALIRQREVTKREQLVLDKQLFEQRSSLRQVKSTLPEPYKEGDDELLITQKPQKKRSLENTAQRPAPVPVRLPTRLEGKSSDGELVMLTDLLAKRDAQTSFEIGQKIQQHERWNENYVDMTREPLTPPHEDSYGLSFRPATTEYLPFPTPPDSIDDNHGENLETKSPKQRPEGVAAMQKNAVSVRYATPPHDLPFRNQPSFRRRIGRGGRTIIDRRGMRLKSKDDVDSAMLEKFKFDQDDDDDEDGFPTYTPDLYSIDSMRYRAATAGNHTAQAMAARRAQIEAAAAAASNQQVTPTPNASGLARSTSD